MHGWQTRSENDAVRLTPRPNPSREDHCSPAHTSLRQRQPLETDLAIRPENLHPGATAIAGSADFEMRELIVPGRLASPAREANA